MEVDIVTLRQPGGIKVIGIGHGEGKNADTKAFHIANGRTLILLMCLAVVDITDCTVQKN